MNPPETSRFGAERELRAPIRDSPCHRADSRAETSSRSANLIDMPIIATASFDTHEEPENALEGMPTSDSGSSSTSDSRCSASLRGVLKSKITSGPSSVPSSSLSASTRSIKSTELKPISSHDRVGSHEVVPGSRNVKAIL